MRQAQMYRNEETGGEGGSGGGGVVDVQTVLNTPEAQAAFQAMLDKEVQGLKKKNSDLIAKEKALKEQMSQYEGVDIEKIKNLQKQMDASEEMRLMSEGKLDDVVARRIELREKDWSQKFGNIEGMLKEKEDTISKLNDRLTGMVIDGQVREAYLSLDFNPKAMDDVISRARKVFVMDEDGKAVPRDENGNVIYGKDARTPISPRDWLENLAEDKDYLRRPSAGAGAKPNAGSRGVIDKRQMSSTQRIAAGLAERGIR
jgi:hypothetical protein